MPVLSYVYNIVFVKEREKQARDWYQRMRSMSNIT